MRSTKIPDPLSVSQSLAGSMGMLWTRGNVLGESLTGLLRSRVASVRMVAAGDDVEGTGLDMAGVDMEDAPELDPEDGLAGIMGGWPPYLVDSLMFLGGRAGLGGLWVRPGLALAAPCCCCCCCLGLDVAMTSMSNSFPESPETQPQLLQFISRCLPGYVLCVFLIFSR